MHAAQRAVNSQGLVSRAGEVLGAQTGEQVWVYVRQEGQQFDPEPQFDVFRVLQVLLRQRRRLPFLKYVPEIRNELLEVLRNKQRCWLEWLSEEHEPGVTVYSLLWTALSPESSDDPSARRSAAAPSAQSASGWTEQHSVEHEPCFLQRLSAGSFTCEDGVKQKNKLFFRWI